MKAFIHQQGNWSEFTWNSGDFVSLVREAEHAESTADFIHKMAIAQKETNETEYWLGLLFQSS